MQLAPFYQTLTEYPDLGLGTSDPLTFDDACDHYAELMAEGYETRVFRMEPPIGTACGMMVEITLYAAREVAKRIHQRRPYDELPEWLAVTLGEAA